MAIFSPYGAAIFSQHGSGHTGHTGPEVTWSGDLLKTLELNQREIFEDTGAMLRLPSGKLTVRYGK